MNKEMVNHPDHYKGKNGLECIDVMLDVFGIEATKDFCLLNAFKYLYRCDKKGKKNEDIKKAVWYLNEYNKICEDDKKESLDDTITVGNDCTDYINKKIIKTENIKNNKNLLPIGMDVPYISSKSYTIYDKIYDTLYKELKEQFAEDIYNKLNIASAMRTCQIKLKTIHESADSANIPNELYCTGHPCFFAIDKKGFYVNFICPLNINNNKLTYLDASHLVWKAIIDINYKSYSVERVTIPTYRQITTECSCINIKEDYWITNLDTSPSSNIFYVDKFGCIKQFDITDKDNKKSIVPFVSLRVNF